MEKLTVFNPVALPMKAEKVAAPRLDSIEGKRIGLFWNLKSGGDVALKRVNELLASQYAGTTFSTFTGDVGANQRFITAEQARRVARDFDAVVSSTAD